MGQKEQENFFDKQFEHSKAKLSLLKNYATVWMRKVTLGTPQKSCAIIDTFAGTGYYEDGSEGSPIILLKAAMDYCEQASLNNNINFNEIILIFVEKNPDNFSKLKESIEKYIKQNLVVDKFNKITSHPKVCVYISNTDFENFTKELLKNVSSIIPTLMFIDPFGYKVLSFDIISKVIKQYKYCELMINFMYEEINRFFLAEGNSKHIETLRSFYGPNLAVIKERIRNSNPKDRRENIIKGYKCNLIDSGAEFTLDFDIEKNGKVKMNIIFCTNNLNGFDTMKECMQAVCDNVNFEYHTTNPQISIFDKDDDESLIETMSNYLSSNFAGKTILTEDIKKYAMKHPFIPSKYYKKALIKLEKKDMICNIRKKDGSKRRARSFADGTIVEFIDGD